MDLSTDTTEEDQQDEENDYGEEYYQDEQNFIVKIARDGTMSIVKTLDAAAEANLV